MQYKFIPIIFLLVSFNCTQNSEKNVSINRIDKIDIEFNIKSAEEMIKIAKNLSLGKEIDEAQWNDLFKSDGYKQYLVYSDSVQKRTMIKETIVTVFDKTKKSILDSLLSKPIVFDRNFYKLSLIENFQRLKQNLIPSEKFLKKTDFEKILISADSLAQSLLPKSAIGSLPELYPVYVIVSNPDGSVQENSIVLDLNLMLEMGETGLVKFIAHEFHHNYRKIATKEFNNPLMIELNKIHQEGLADLIDKERPPVSKLGLFPDFLLNAYNSDYLNTPTNLKTLDSLVVSYVKNDKDDTKFEENIRNYFKFGGHTTGIYMSFMIEEAIGKEPLIESYDSPVEFIKIYNSVASELENEHIFTTDFVEYISSLE